MFDPPYFSGTQLPHLQGQFHGKLFVGVQLGGQGGNFFFGKIADGVAGQILFFGKVKVQGHFYSSPEDLLAASGLGRCINIFFPAYEVKEILPLMSYQFRNVLFPPK
jgi:hypothetical protein